MRITKNTFDHIFIMTNVLVGAVIGSLTGVHDDWTTMFTWEHIKLELWALATLIALFTAVRVHGVKTGWIYDPFAYTIPTIKFSVPSVTLKTSDK
jgi:hypothetical protein